MREIQTINHLLYDSIVRPLGGVLLHNGMGSLVYFAFEEPNHWANLIKICSIRLTSLVLFYFAFFLGSQENVILVKLEHHNVRTRFGVTNTAATARS